MSKVSFHPLHNLNSTVQAYKDFLCAEDLHPIHKLPDCGFVPDGDFGGTILHNLHRLFNPMICLAPRPVRFDVFALFFQIRHFLSKRPEAFGIRVIPKVACGFAVSSDGKKAWLNMNFYSR